MNPYREVINRLLGSGNLGHERMASIALSNLEALAQAWEEGYTFGTRKEKRMRPSHNPLWACLHHWTKRKEKRDDRI